jgi:hypothetical protein|tara:strand:+ start:98 stop:274 length:177 start_codon:yes stop_codon:yes gene_type:complete
MLQDLGKIIQDLVVHELDIITESIWFEELVEKKVQEVLNKQGKEKESDVYQGNEMGDK